MKSFARTVADWEWLVLLMTMPAILFLDDYRYGLLLIPFILWGFRKIGYGYFMPPTPFNLANILFLSQLALSVIVVFDVAISGPKIMNILWGLMLFYASVHLSRSRDQGLWIVLVTLFLLGVAIAVVGILGNVWQPPFDFLNVIALNLPLQSGKIIPEMAARSVNPNELAGTLCWIAPLMVAFLMGDGKNIWDHNKIYLVLLILGTALTIFVLLATLSRGGILALVLGLSVIIGLYVQPRWRLVLAVGLLVGGSALFFNYQNPQVTGEALHDPIGLSSRLEIWNRALLAIADFPLIGVSVNGFRALVGVFYPLFQIPVGIDIAHAHNHFLQATLDLGIPGLIIYLAIWLIGGSLLYGSRRYLAKRGIYNHPYYALVAGLSGSMVAGWVFGIFDSVALGARPAFIWWILLSLCAASHYAIQYSNKRIRRRHRHSHSETIGIEANEPQTVAERPLNQLMPLKSSPVSRPSLSINRRYASFPIKTNRNDDV